MQVRLCVGTGREPISRRSPADENVISTCFLTMQSGQEMRLGLIAQLFSIAERGYLIRFPSYSELDKYHKEVLEVLTKMDHLYRLISPLPGN
jgi:GTP1/Obg family GTP-binding protein